MSCAQFNQVTAHSWYPYTSIASLSLLSTHRRMSTTIYAFSPYLLILTNTLFVVNHLQLQLYVQFLAILERPVQILFFFFLNDTPPPEISPLPQHAPFPI